MYQGAYKRVLAVCSGGLLRSPTIAHLLSKEYDYNTRCVGTKKEYALIGIDEVLLMWADEIVCADDEHADIIKSALLEMGLKTPVVNLEIPDYYEYMDAKLVEMIKDRYEKHLLLETKKKKDL